MDVSSIIDDKDRWWAIPTAIFVAVCLSIAGLANAYSVLYPNRYPEAPGANRAGSNADDPGNAQDSQRLANTDEDTGRHRVGKPVVVDHIPSSIIDAHRELLGSGRFVGHDSDHLRYVPSAKIKVIQQDGGCWLVSAFSLEWVETLVSGDPGPSEADRVREEMAKVVGEQLEKLRSE